MIVEKDPADIRPFELNWAVELDGQTITTSEWFGSLTQASPTIDGTTTRVTLSGGQERDYDMVNRIVTSGGETLEKTLTVKVREL